MGCFSDVDIRIDTATGGGPDDYEVTFQVTELGRARGTINTMVGNQEGSLLTGLAAPNLLGICLLATLSTYCTCKSIPKMLSSSEALLR